MICANNEIYHHGVKGQNGVLDVINLILKENTESFSDKIETMI